MIKQFIIFPSKVCVQQRGSAVIGAIIKGGGGSSPLKFWKTRFRDNG